MGKRNTGKKVEKIKKGKELGYRYGVGGVVA